MCAPCNVVKEKRVREVGRGAFRCFIIFEYSHSPYPGCALVDLELYVRAIRQEVRERLWGTFHEGLEDVPADNVTLA